MFRLNDKQSHDICWTSMHISSFIDMDLSLHTAL